MAVKEQHERKRPVNWPKDLNLPTREEVLARLPAIERFIKEEQLRSRSKAPGYLPVLPRIRVGI